MADAGEGSKLSRANRPIQNRIGDGRKIASVIDELKIELVIEEPNSGLLIEQLKVEQFPFLDCHSKRIKTPLSGEVVTW